MVVAFNKPYGVLSQFTLEQGSKWRTLADFGLPAQVYPIGRLDADSEGLLVLSDEADLVQTVLEGHVREYWVQVEGILGDDAMERLRSGVLISGHRTKPAAARRLEREEVDLPVREPPIRMRKTVPDSWIALELTEGKNRQVRRMTAAVGHPTLRLVRVRIGELSLGNLGIRPGAWKPVLRRALSGRPS